MPEMTLEVIQLALLFVVRCGQREAGTGSFGSDATTGLVGLDLDGPGSH